MLMNGLAQVLQKHHTSYIILEILLTKTMYHMAGMFGWDKAWQI